MWLALDDVVARVKQRIEDGGRELADAAAPPVSTISPSFDAGRENEAIFLGARPHDGVQRRRLARLHHQPVEQSGNAVNVVDARLAAGVTES